MPTHARLNDCDCYITGLSCEFLRGCDMTCGWVESGGLEKEMEEGRRGQRESVCGLREWEKPELLKASSFKPVRRILF